MILDFFILFVLLILAGAGWHFGYTWYKEREWRKNNLEEFNWVKKYDRRDSRNIKE